MWVSCCKKNLTHLTDMSKDLQIILTDMPENLQIISISSIFLYFSPIFSKILRFSPNFSVFLYISRFFFVSLHSKSAALQKRWRCYNLYKSIKKRCSPAVRDG